MYYIVNFAFIRTKNSFICSSWQHLLSAQKHNQC